MKNLILTTSSIVLIVAAFFLFFKGVEHYLFSPEPTKAIFYTKKIREVKYHKLIRNYEVTFKLHPLRNIAATIK